MGRPCDIHGACRPSWSISMCLGTVFWYGFWDYKNMNKGRSETPLKVVREESCKKIYLQRMDN